MKDLNDNQWERFDKLRSDLGGVPVEEREKEIERLRKAGDDAHVLDFVVNHFNGELPDPLRTRVGDADEVPSHDPDAPLRISDYVLEEQLGKGGMGKVFRAFQRSLQRYVALKILLRAGDAKSEKRFLREALAIARLRHPNIVGVHGIGRTETGDYFLVMDLVKGRDLSALVRDGPVDIERAIDLLTAIAEAIAHANEKGVIHRDLKPANVLLDESGRVLVTDFGLAKVVPGDTGDFQSSSGLILGTPNYMPPEQGSGKWGQVAAWSDVYGLGGILYSLLTGRPPYSGHTAAEIVAKVLSDDYPPSPRMVRPDVPESIDAICMKCLSKEPAHRYQSAVQVKEALDSYLRSVRLQTSLTSAPLSRSVEQAKALAHLRSKAPPSLESLANNQHTLESDALTLPFYLQAWINTGRADQELESCARTVAGYLGVRFETLSASMQDAGVLSDESVFEHLSPPLIKFFKLGTFLGQANQTTKFHKTIQEHGGNWRSMLKVARVGAVTLARSLMPSKTAQLEKAFDCPTPDDCRRALLQWIDDALFDLINGESVKDTES